MIPVNDRITILINLAGGPDLYSLAYDDQYDDLANLRQQIIIPENLLLGLSETEIRLHPSLEGLRDLFQDGKVAFIPNAGSPNFNRSHPRQSANLSAGEDGGSSIASVDSGILARYVQRKYKGYPSEFPNNDFKAPVIISSGFGIPFTQISMEGGGVAGITLNGGGDAFRRLVDETPIGDNVVGNSAFLKAAQQHYHRLGFHQPGA
ncbi:MAG: hypothetical protein AAGM67_01605 [Bacteroidota bacterium]